MKMNTDYLAISVVAIFAVIGMIWIAMPVGNFSSSNTLGGQATKSLSTNKIDSLGIKTESLGTGINWISCSDTPIDVPYSPYIKGTVTATYLNGKITTTVSRDDVCIIDQVNKATLTEYYCNGNQPIMITLNCRPGETCANGACVSALPPNSCDDSDGGLDYVVFGIAKGMVNGNPSIIKDVCVDQKMLREAYCDTTNKPSSQDYKCDYECSNGECISAPVGQPDYIVQINAPASANVGSNVSFSVVTKNIGTAAGLVYTYTDTHFDTPSGSQTSWSNPVQPLAVNGSYALNFNAPCDAAGYITINSSADTHHSIVESNEDNNAISRQILCVVPPSTCLPGDIDPTFYTGTGASYPYSLIWDIEVQPDGKTITGGAFQTFNGVNQPSLVRLLTNGSVDTSFDYGTVSMGQVYDIDLMQDGKMMVSDDFSFRVRRLNQDGSVDSSFGAAQFMQFSGGTPRTIHVQADGKVLAGGPFRINAYNGINYTGIIRYTNNGSIDNTFNPGSGTLSGLFPGEVNKIKTQTNNKIVLAGDFVLFDGVSRNGIARINADGSLDTSYNPGQYITKMPGVNIFVQSFAIQPDGKTIYVGYFDTLINGVPGKSIIRVNQDGSPDTTFSTPSITGGSIQSVYVQPNGKIVIMGQFSINGVNKGLARLKADGSLDTTFNSLTCAGNGNFCSDVGNIEIYDGKLYVGGRTAVIQNGITYRNVIRVCT